MIQPNTSTGPVQSSRPNTPVIVKNHIVQVAEEKATASRNRNDEQRTIHVGPPTHTHQPYQTPLHRHLTKLSDRPRTRYPTNHRCPSCSPPPVVIVNRLLTKPMRIQPPQPPRRRPTRRRSSSPHRSWTWTLLTPPPLRTTSHLHQHHQARGRARRRHCRPW